MKSVVALFSLLFLALTANAGNDHKHPQAKVAPAFEKMKALLGTWEGKSTMDGKEQDFKVTYELTSGGTAIIEKMSPGTPMEMVTVYSTNGKTVNATHYCALGNQPEFTLKKSNDNAFVFEMVGSRGISSKGEMHMHGVTLTLNGSKLKQDWTNYDHGKKGDTHSFELTKN